MPSTIPIKMIKVSRCERMLSPVGRDEQHASISVVRKPSSRGSGATAQAEEGRVVGLGGDDPDRHHRLVTGALDIESPDHSGEDQGGLGQSKLGADADARSDTERQIGEAIGGWGTGKKPCRVEDLRLCPQPAVPVQDPGSDEHYRAGGYPNAAGGI